MDHHIITPQTSLLPALRQPLLQLAPLGLPHGRHLLLRRVEARCRLVEGVLGAALKLAPHELDALLPPQARPLLLQLRQAARLKRRVRGAEAPLRVPLDLVRARVRRRQLQRVERVVDARRRQRRSAAAGGGGGGVVIVAEAEVVKVAERAGARGRRGGRGGVGLGVGVLLLRGRLGVAGLGGLELALFGGEQRVALGLLARCLGLLLFCGFSAQAK